MLLASVGPGEVCLTALVMDRFCIDRGTLLDVCHTGLEP